MRVCYFGAYDPDYPRNRILRAGLAECGATVMMCQVPTDLPRQEANRALHAQFKSDECDYIVLAEFGQMQVETAWRLARRYRLPLVVDFFTSVYDSSVLDRGNVKWWSPKAAVYYMLDWFTLRVADAILVDTEQHRRYFARMFGVRQTKMHVIPVGAPPEWLEQVISPVSSPIRVQFYGTYIPLHGVDVIIDAAHHLRGRDDIRIELIGAGQLKTKMQAYAAQFDLPNLTFHPPLAPYDLPTAVARADITLGIFGVTNKAQRVIPNKVYQTMALGKPTITADTLAIREAFTPREHLITVPVGEPAALADAILMLADNPHLRQQLGVAAREVIGARFTQQVIGQRLFNLLQRSNFS